MRKKTQPDLVSLAVQEKKTTIVEVMRLQKEKQKRKECKINFSKRVTRLDVGVIQDSDEIHEQRQLIALNVWIAQAKTVVKKDKDNVLERLRNALQMQINIIQHCPYPNLTESSRLNDVHDHQRAMLIIQLIYHEQLRKSNPEEEARLEAEAHLSKIKLDTEFYRYHLTRDETDTTTIDSHIEQIQQIHQKSLEPLSDITLKDPFLFDWDMVVLTEFLLLQYERYLYEGKNPAFLADNASQFALYAIFKTFDRLPAQVEVPYRKQKSPSSEYLAKRFLLSYSLLMAPLPDFQFVIDAEIVELLAELLIQFPTLMWGKGSPRLEQAIKKSISSDEESMLLTVFNELLQEEIQKKQKARVAKALSQPLPAYRTASEEKPLPAIRITHQKKKKSVNRRAPKPTLFQPAATHAASTLQEASDALSQRDFQSALVLYARCAQQYRDANDIQQALNIGCLQLDALMKQYLYVAQHSQNKTQELPDCLNACLTQGKMLLTEIEGMSEPDKIWFTSNYAFVFFTACQFYLLIGDKNNFDILFSEYSVHVKTWFSSAVTLHENIINETQLKLLRIDCDVLYAKQDIDAQYNPHFRFKLTCQYQSFWQKQFEECKATADNLKILIKGHPDSGNHYDDLYKTLEFMMFHLKNIIEESIQYIIHYQDTAESYQAELTRITEILIRQNRPKPEKPAKKTLLTYRYRETLATEQGGGAEHLQKLRALRDEVCATQFGLAPSEDATSRLAFVS